MRDMQDEAGAPLIAAHDAPTPPPTTPEPSTGSPSKGSPATGDTDPVAPRRRRMLFLLMGATAVVAYAADQVTKVWAQNTLTTGEPVDVVGDHIRLNLIRNAGAAFSIGNGATWVMTLVACGVLVFVLRTARRIGSSAWAVALGLLLGGSLGNLTDRMVRSPGPGRGQVVDFIDYFGFFIGNVADIAIVGAAAFIALLAVRGIGVDGARPHQGRHEAAAQGSQSGGAAHV
jgi:signal peptidase II